jgi:hypothetical protein
VKTITEAVPAWARKLVGMRGVIWDKNPQAGKTWPGRTERIVLQLENNGWARELVFYFARRKPGIADGGNSTSTKEFLIVRECLGHPQARFHNSNPFHCGARLSSMEIGQKLDFLRYSS